MEMGVGVKMGVGVGVDGEPRIIHRSGVGSSAGIRQWQNLSFKRLFIDRPTLIFVEHGIKVLRWPGGEYVIRAGDAIALAGGHTVDFTNHVGSDGLYRADWLVCDDTLIAEHAARHPEQAVIRNALPIIQPPLELKAAYRTAQQAVEDEAIPQAIARHRVAEMLVWLGLNGGRFAQDETISLALKVRRLIAQDLAKEWGAVAVSSALAMSEATLRRRLAEEDTSFGEILVDTRMTMALAQLQSTAQPVTRIALNVGYQSPSNFSVRFRERFGFPPSSIRGQRALSA